MDHAPLPPPGTAALPQPPPDWPSPAAAPSTERPGQLTPGWRVMTGVVWAGIILGMVCVWWASRKLGMSTWWLGPPSEPRLFLVTIVPFVAPVVAVTAALRRVPYTPFVGLGAGVLTIAVGVGDAGRVPGLAAVEMALGAAGVLVSLAAFSGMYRSA